MSGIIGTTGSSGIIGKTGSSGHGMAGIGIPICCICKKPAPSGKIVDDDFNRTMGLAMLESNKICQKCYHRTEKLLKAVNMINPSKLPLLVSHPNKFVRSKAIKRLEILL